MAKSGKTIKVGRKAGNGQFTSKSFAKRHPKTTVIETIRKAKKG